MEEQQVQAPVQGMVIYTDGGCRCGNPGFAGWGIHGYLYTSEVSKQGTGLSDHIMTIDGYVRKGAFNDLLNKKKAPVQIYPVTYVDGYGSFALPATNNVAEIVAATQALIYAAQFAITSIKILSDSEYVINGSMQWMKKWKEAKWMRPDYTPVPNTEYWKELDHAMKVLKDRDVIVEFEWIQSHEGHLGNTNADKHATVGVMMSKAGNTATSIETTPAAGYWKYEVEKHPFIASPRMYFNTQEHTVTPGTYYLGSHGKDDEILGTRIADGAYAYIELGTPDPVLEIIRKTQCLIANGLDAIVLARLDYAFSPDVHKDLIEFGQFAMEQRNALRFDLYGLDREPLTREFKPPLLAVRAVEEFSSLVKRLDAFKKGDPSIVVTDITSVLYEVVESIKKKVLVSEYKLKDSFIVGFSALDIAVKYKTKDEIGSIPITLSLGIDLPNRNSLKRLEAFRPTVSVVTWRESDNAFRYGVVIKTDTDIGIWAGAYSNLRLID